MRASIFSAARSCEFSFQYPDTDRIAAASAAVCRRTDTARELAATKLAMNESSGGLTQKHLAVLKSSEWFAALEPAFQQAVLASSRVIVLGAGEPVFHRGDPGDGLYCVLSGAVRFDTIAPSGKELIVALIEAPEWFGEIALFDGGVRTNDVWVDVPSTLLHLPLRHLTRMLASDPGLWEHLGRLVVRKLRVALSLLEDLALEPPRVRLARCLINLFEGYGQRKAEPPHRVRVSQERLGMMLSLTRQTVNELLRHMEKESIIECERGGVRVLDLGRLRRAGRVWISS